jgi:hypothetical protein
MKQFTFQTEAYWMLIFALLPLVLGFLFILILIVFADH